MVEVLDRIRNKLHAKFPVDLKVCCLSWPSEVANLRPVVLDYAQCLGSY